MPKYIRTKDGIFELVNTEIHFGKTEELKSVKFYKAYQPERISLCKHKYTRSVEVSRVIKSADTIEDLIDIFVDTSALNDIHNGAFYYGYEKKALIYFNESEDTRHVPIIEWDDKSVIKGAIWTDKGLIYVAKMNEKGELELL